MIILFMHTFFFLDDYTHINQKRENDVDTDNHVN